MMTFVFLTNCDFGDSSKSSNSSKKESEKDSSISIVRIYWTLRNIDDKFWKGQAPGSSCIFVPAVEFENTKDFTAEDIESAKFELMIDDFNSTGTFWTFDIEKYPQNLDIEKKIIFSSPGFVINAPDKFPLGKFKFSIKLKKEKAAEYMFELPAPGSKTASPYSFVYTEDFIGSISTSYTQMIKRAVIFESSFVKSTGTITIKFKTDDTRVYNGTIWFYDSDKSYVASSSKFFRDPSSRKINSFVNSGSDMKTDNTENVLNLTASDLNFTTGDINSIKYAVVVLMDGYQYLDWTSSSYDCYSVTGQTEVVVK